MKKTMGNWINNLRDAAQTLTNEQCLGHACHPSITHRDIPFGIIVDVSAVLWTIDCPAKGSVNTIVENFVEIIK